MPQRLPLVLAFCAAFVSPAAIAVAEDSPPPLPSVCLSTDPQGDLPSCEYDGTKWSPTFPQDIKDAGSTVRNFAILGFVAVLVLGIGGTVLRVRMARRIATDAGMNPDAAAAATLLGTGGLTATYLAATLHPQPDAQDTPPVHDVEPPTRSAETRLADLKHLKDEGLITDDEYGRRRAAIIDSV